MLANHHDVGIVIMMRASSGPAPSVEAVIVA